MNQLAALTSEDAKAPSGRPSVPAKRFVDQPQSAVAPTYLDAILQAARNPAVDVDKMERLMRLHEQMLADEARKTFIRAKIAMRPQLPKVEKNGLITITEKGNSNKVIQSTPFAKFEDIHDAVFPVLISHGFDLDYRTGTREGRVVVTAVLSHENGHREETTLDGPLDTSGSKNNVQGVGSTLSYLKRYTMCAILNIRTADKGEFDDDGHKSGDHEARDTISPDQVKTLRSEMEARGIVEAKFLAFIMEDRLEDMSAGKFESALDNIRRRQPKKA